MGEEVGLRLMRENARAENQTVKQEIRKGSEDKGPYFQLVPLKKESTETERLKDKVHVLEERLDRLTKRMCVLEWNGEVRGSSSSEDGFGREWRWVTGAWWFKVPTGRNVRVNARLRRKVSRVVKQLLEQEGRESGDEKWTSWARGREAGNALTETGLAGWQLQFVGQRWCSLGRVMPGTPGKDTWTCLPRSVHVTCDKCSPIHSKVSNSRNWN